ncbi:hypothetical protein ABEX47_27525 [Paenibacillus ehimensis]|uniref:hypothetical protein n=1 Tax=Paenibacillus ehimensis TaxID=79264 RepID=UPI003D271491
MKIFLLLCVAFSLFTLQQRQSQLIPSTSQFHFNQIVPFDEVEETVRQVYSLKNDAVVFSPSKYVITEDLMWDFSSTLLKTDFIFETPTRKLTTIKIYIEEHEDEIKKFLFEKYKIGNTEDKHQELHFNIDTIYRTSISYEDDGNNQKIVITPLRMKNHTISTCTINMVVNCDQGYRKLWDLIHTIYGNYSNRIGAISFFTDGVGGNQAYLEVLKDDDYSKWNLFIDLNDTFYEENSSYRNFKKLKGTLIHELGHIITLNETQREFTKYPQDERLIGLTGRLSEDAYLTKFDNLFWSSKRNEWKTGRYSFNSYPNDFVSEYASLNEIEDIAESFRNYILQDSNGNETVKDKKIIFFNNFMEFTTYKNYYLKKEQEINLLEFSGI